MRALASPIVMRALIGSGPKAEKREDAAVLQRAKRTDVELWHAAEQRGNPVAFRNPVLGQNIGKAIYRRAKRFIGEFADGVVASDPAQSKLVAAPGFYMPIDRLMGNVEAAAGKTVKYPTRLRPGKRLGALVIVDEVGADVFFRTFSDSLQFHGWPWAIFLKLRTSQAAPRAPAAVPNPPK